MRAAVIGVFTLLIILAAPCAQAFETDQFTLPTKRLQDIGPDVSVYVYEALQGAVADINRKMGKGQSSARSDRRRSSDAVAEAVFRHIGGGVALTSRVEGWSAARGKLTKKYGSGAALKSNPDVLHNVYAWSTHVRTPLYVIRSSTVNLYGVELGTDKLGHFFKQGIQYFRRYRSQLGRHPKSKKSAEEAPVSVLGEVAEGTYFGAALTGVYSNADLATNFAGLKFYENLLAPVRIGGATYPAILRVRANGTLEISSATKARTFFRRFVSAHMNEAMNPSWIEPGPMRAGVRANVKSRCEAWKARYPRLTKSKDARRVRSLSTWYGQNYGHKGEVKDLVSVGNVCFSPREKDR